MSSRFDVESLLKEALALIQAGLPAKITAVNAEKSGDAEPITLEAIPNAQYFVDSGAQVFNHNEFIYYGITDLSTTANGQKTAIEVTMQFEVVFNNANTGKTLEKVLRYSRCLREVVQDDYRGSKKHTGFLVSELVPANAPLNEGSDYKIGGIEIIATIVG